MIADKCTDDTAQPPGTRGHLVERDDPSARGKGRALRRALEQMLDRDPEMDAFLVVDADSMVDPGMLSALGRAFSGWC